MPKATAVIINANVLTLNQKQPTAEAIAIQNGKIVVVGSNKEIRKCINEKTQVINAKNKTVTPGLIDCHVHMKGFGQLLQTLDLRNVKSIKDMQHEMREYASETPNKNWIQGGRWDQDKFSEKRYPNRRDLDIAVSDRPAFLVRVCGHIGVANTKALQLAGITRDTRVNGGKIDLDEATGEPNGILRENALDLIWKAIPKPDFKELEETCILACNKAVEAGLTSVHWMVGSTQEIRVIQKLYVERRLPLKVYLGIPVSLLDEIINLGITTGFGNDMVRIGFIKILVDGSLGARTASLKEAYADKPETRGMMLYTKRKLNRLFLKAHKAGLQLAVHAIGDNAINAVINAFKTTLKKHPRENHRHRIEHASVLDPMLIRHMKNLGLIASIQPHFAVSDFWVGNRVGENRARWVYPFKTLIKEGLIVASGSDSPVEPINPLLGIWAAVAKNRLKEENITVDEALKTYTSNAAYASFDEDNRGTIEVGKSADLTVLSSDLPKIPSDDIKRVNVEMTIVKGEIVYAREFPT